MPPSTSALAGFHPLVCEWFESQVGVPTEPQKRGWPHIAQAQDTLIAAPTGSGKTLAAFLSCLDKLIQEGMQGRLREETRVVYVSPLKALSNDIRKNLERPLAELGAFASKRGLAFPPIRVATRTGDTPASERQKMVKTPPHILVTTPESLYILLTAEKSRRMLASVETVIVDEIHAIAGDKRGAHLSLSLARLDRLAQMAQGRRPARIGLSATQKPIDRIGKLLVGSHPNPVIVDTGHAREVDLAIEMTDDELGAVASNEQCGRVYDRIAELVASHETTLVFVNTRALVERIAHQLEERLGEDQVVAHHGSLSRKLRLAAEEKLKSGSVRCAVATASLELGIDIGSVDLVIQVGSPRAIATLLQRVGRSGHSVGKTPKGRLFALTRDQLCECAALVRAAKHGKLDEVELVPAPLDVLAQQIVAITASEDIEESELLSLIRSAAHYQDFDDKSFDRILDMLAEGPAPARGRFGAYVHRDRINHTLKARRGARLTAITCGGAIPDNANYPVILYPDETPIGNLDEDFAIESSPGDIVLLGNTSWRIRRVEAGRVLVEDAKGAPPNIPFWFGEAPARTRELSDEISDLRRDFEDRLLQGQHADTLAQWIAGESAMSQAAAAQVVDYLTAGREALGALPTRQRVIAERFFDDGGGMQLIIHAPFGARVNKAWGLALRKRFCRSFNLELQAAATDDGIILSLGPVHSFPLEEVSQFLRSNTARKVLEQATLGAPVFGVRWRWAVTRALSVLRRRGGKKVPPHLVRMRTDDLLSMIFPMQQACLENVVGDIEIPDHPLVFETMRDCLTEFMDIDGLVDVLRGLEDGSVEFVCRENVEPSPLCHELINANPYAFLDEVPLEERRTRAVTLPRRLRKDIDGDTPIVDDASIAQAEAQAVAPVRDADELHDDLLTLWLVPEREKERGLFAELATSGRASAFTVGQKTLWVAAERLPAVALLFDVDPTPLLPPLAPELADKLPSEPHTVAEKIVVGHMSRLGPRTKKQLEEQLHIAGSLIAQALATLESHGTLLRRTDDDVATYCDRRMMARIHRLTLGRLRSSVEPVSPAALMRFLFRWQRVLPGTQLTGPQGLHEVISQLQGFESAAAAWEQHILSARLADYRPAWLDALCQSGQVAWARLSPKQQATSKKAPTKTAPLSLLLREDLSWLRAGEPQTECDWLSAAAQTLLQHLRSHGASFLADLVRDTSLDAQALEGALWELVSAGLASADGFSCLRVLIDRPSGESRSHFDEARPQAKSSKWQRALTKARARDGQRRVHAVHALPTAQGRWSLLPTPRLEDVDADRVARQLLARYGIVFRDLLGRETSLPPWRDIAGALRRLEARGEVRGGRFVSGFIGEQFALPEVVGELRALRAPNPGRPEWVRIAATDPLNLIGVTSAGPRVPATLGNAILFRDGVPLASLESGERVLRAQLEDGERVDADLVYHAKPKRQGSQGFFQWNSSESPVANEPPPG